MRKQRDPYISSTVISVLLHLIFFFAVAISLKTCTGPVSTATRSSPPVLPTIDAEVISQQEVNTYYERKQQEALEEERILQLEKEKQERARQLAEEQKKAELLRQKKLQEEKEKQEKARLEQLRKEEQEKQQQTELRRKEEAEQERLEQQRRLAEEKQKQLEEEQRRLAEEKQKQLEEEQRRLEAEKQKQLEEEQRRLEAEKQKQLEEEQRRLEAEKQKQLEEEQRRLEAEKQKQLEEEQRRLAEHRKKEEAERLKMRKKQIAVWQRQYEQMIRNSVEQHWKKPPASVKGGECVLKLRQNEVGTILEVNFIRCEGDKLFIRSVEAAVWKADPLPKPPSPDVFDAEIEFTFKRDY